MISSPAKGAAAGWIAVVRQPANNNPAPSARVAWSRDILVRRDAGESMATQRTMQCFRVSAIPSFDGADHIDGAGVRATERAIVRDVLDARAARRDHAAQLGEPTRSIADRRRESLQAAVVHESF